jgi:hypothetical protein
MGQTIGCSPLHLKSEGNDMSPIDADDPNAFPNEDPREMLQAMTRAFAMILSRQPNMTFEISMKELQDFAFENYEIGAHTDESAMTWFLSPKDKRIQ